MKVVCTVADLKKEIDSQRKRKLSIGFVPTMGALHKGHLSLVEEAGKQCGCVVVSIFVNPTQFNNTNDLKRYPRNLDADIDMLKQTACKLVFAPSVNEIYPEKDKRKFDFGKLETVMEGKFRPGHFNGVAQVVSKLFDMVKPDKAFFGRKDFQQLAIICRLNTMLGTGIEIIGCPTVREPDGLAMSSRNKLLNEAQRKNAALISQTLFNAVKKTQTLSVGELKKWVIETIDKNPFLETEYFELVDDENLDPIENWEGKFNKTGCIAVQCGEVRLIDNVKF
ncbi:MAG: pantoate--beta-alanine ligase [Prolixibacteraceae bacterium]|nr:pantoate--beta-alanine ligase [Prolixibacteraceae bacterium]